MAQRFFDLSADWHVHSTFSDGLDSIEQNVKVAIQRGIKTLGCVDHVRRDTKWLPSYVETVRQIRRKYEGKITLYCCIEAKFLDASGTLDVPELVDGIDYIFAADHQFPYGKDILKPNQVKELLDEELVTKETLFRHLIRATIGAMWKYPNVVIAHLFSILPKVGLKEEDVPLELLAALARAAIETDTPIEVSERWTCPNLDTARFLWDMGVTMPVSTDSHKKETIGLYNHIVRIKSHLFPPLSMVS